MVYALAQTSWRVRGSLLRLESPRGREGHEAGFGVRPVGCLVVVRSTKGAGALHTACWLGRQYRYRTTAPPDACRLSCAVLSPCGVDLMPT
jgi:hypothetical protein